MLFVLTLVSESRKTGADVRFLADTNVVITAEPARVDEAEPGLAHVLDFLRVCAEGGHTVQVHPAALVDFARDSDAGRRDLRRKLLRKYPPLGHPPPLPSEFGELFGRVEAGSNDHVDLSYLAAVYADAVDFLVTEDDGIHRKARRVGLGGRVLRVNDAISTLTSLFPVLPEPPPAVERRPAHALDRSDPIWHTLREDYSGFDKWFSKIRREQRDTYVIESDGMYAGVCILKTEQPADHGLPGRQVKISTFKVSPEHSGFRYGELLLKATFEHATNVDADGIYVTVFDKYPDLITLLEDFGFCQLTDRHAQTGELVLAKKLRWTDEEYSDNVPLDFHVRFGPPAIKVVDGSSFVVPIQPQWHDMLFPECRDQLELLSATHAFGNALRKAYLCHSPTRQVQPGATLLFYRSGGFEKVSVIAVCEEAFVSASADEIAHVVGKRTVYRYDEIQQWARQPTLVLLFRQTRVLHSDEITMTEMMEQGILNRAPQSIVAVRTTRGTEWLRQRLSA